MSFSLGYTTEEKLAIRNQSGLLTPLLAMTKQTSLSPFCTVLETYNCSGKRASQLPMTSFKHCSNRRSGSMMKYVSVWVTLIMATTSSKIVVEGKHVMMHGPPTDLVSENSIPLDQSDIRMAQFVQRDLQSGSSGDSAVGDGTSQKTGFPQRVRVAPFDLLLAPTPIQLQRADEDALLVELQELIIIFMKTQFGEEGSVNRMGTSTTLEYVLFSDIEQNSWTLGKKDPSDPPRTILRFNGGVASFLGPDTPTEKVVNEWVEAAVDGLFAPALAETPYNYMEVTQYMVIDDLDSPVRPADIVVNIPSTTTNFPEGSRPVQMAAQQPPLSSGPDGSQTSLLYILVSALCVIAVVAVILSLWIRHNNRAVRILCLSDRDKEEVVDFSDQGSISIKHGTGDKYSHHDEDYDTDYDDHSLKKDSLIRVEDDLQTQISIAAQHAIEEASLQSESTFPTVSALSFRSPNPFGAKSVVSQESFQKERKTYLSKDMMYSPWSGKPPNFDSLRGKRHDESVLKPSYFSAEKECITKKTPQPKKKSKKVLYKDSEDDRKDPVGFRFEQAHENGEEENGPDGLYMISPSQPPKTKQNGDEEVSALKRAPSDFV